MDQPGLNHLRAQDRDELSTLLTALHGAMNALRRDECGDWTIFGSRGHIRACDGTFHVYVQCRSALHWTYAKRQLASFSMVHQDGDDEGILLLTRMPNANEAATLRNYVGLRQTRNVGPDHGYWLHRKAHLRGHLWPFSSFKTATGYWRAAGLIASPNQRGT